MSEGDQDHSGVPVTIAVIAYGLDQALDLLLGQVLPCPQLTILQPPRNCSIYALWRDQLEASLGHIISRFEPQHAAMHRAGLMITQQTAQCPHLTPGQRMRARRTALYPADVQGSPSEINLIPT